MTAEGGSRPVREAKLTLKGLALKIEDTMKKRRREMRKLIDLTSSIDPDKITDYTKMKTNYMVWLSAYDSFLEANQNVTAILNDEERYQDAQNMEEHMERFLRFKAKVEDWFAQNKPSTAKKSIGKRSRFSKISTLSLARLTASQKKVELEVRAQRLEEEKRLEWSMLDLQLKKKELQIQTEIDVIDARTNVIDKELSQHGDDVDDIDAAFNVPPLGHGLNENQPDPQHQPMGPNSPIQHHDDQPDPQHQPMGPNSPVQHHDDQPDPQHQPMGPDSPVQQYDYEHQPVLQRNPVGLDLPAQQPDPFRVPRVPVTPHGPPSPVLDQPTVGTSVHSEPHEPCRRGFPQPAFDASLSHASGNRDALPMEIVRELRKPTPDLKKFSGNPIEFTKFVRQFRFRIESNTSSADERMNYLEQYTEGEARKIVSGYSCLDAEIGYPAALRELNRRYGDSELIANAYVKRALNWPVIKPDHPKGLDEYALFLVECLNAVKLIQALQILEYNENLKHLISKLPYHLHDRWRNIVTRKRDDNQRVCFSDMVSFVQREAKKVMDPVYGRAALQPVKTKQNEQKPKQGKSFATCSTGSNGTNQSSVSTSNTSPGNKQPRRPAFDKPCEFCKIESHALVDCDVFVKKPPKDKSDFIRAKGLCFGCLKKGSHQSKDCRNRASCKVCKGKHPSLLHDDTRISSSSTRGTTSSACFDVSRFQAHMGAGTSDFEGECTMAIIPVKVRLKDSLNLIETLAFLDPGSGISFCSENLMRQLGVTGQRTVITLDTTGDRHSMKTSIVSGLEVTNIDGNNPISLPKVYSKDSLPVSSHQMPKTEDLERWDHLKDVELPEANGGCKEVGLLLGNAIAEAYTPLRVITGPKGAPHATLTSLGWVVWNLVRKTRGDDAYPVHYMTAVHQLENDQELDRLVRSTIAMDFPEKKLMDSKKHPSRDDELFYQRVNESISHENGHYVIGLPFREPEPVLPNNKEVAMQRLKMLKRKFQKNPQFQTDYTNFMNKIIDAGYAEKVPEPSNTVENGKVWFIPHHGIYHPHKPGKIRVVFDCSARHLGICVNDVLLAGPNLTNDLLGVLLRFRHDPVGVIGDIEAMYYQVRVPTEHRDYMRFYWWPNGNVEEPAIEYRMAVHSFGTASSAAISNFALKKTADDNCQEFTEDVCNTVRRNFYVDDCLKGHADTATAIDKTERVSQLCKKGGFKLAKFSSNKSEVIETIPTEDRSKELQHTLDLDEIPVERALGTTWYPTDDTLSFKISLPDKPCTKRGLLSVINSVYDPIGLVAPVVLPARILLQRISSEKDWDDIIDEKDQQRWQQWLKDISQVENLIAVPRSLKPEGFDVVSIQLHTFADSSDVAYGIASYVRMLDANGQVRCNLLLAKSRVAPAKKITTPRLELTAATMAVRITSRILEDMEYKFDLVTYWTDSMSVLRYIHNTKTRFQTCVANRLAIIYEASTPDQWNHINSKDNPADISSRGLNLRNGKDVNRWLNGPKILRESEWSWQNEEEDYGPVADNDPEVKKVVTSTTVVDNKSENEGDNYLQALFCQSSTMSKLVRAVAWILRAKTVLKERLKLKGNTDSHSKVQGKPSRLTPSELKTAELAIVKYVQQCHFTEKTLRNTSIQKLDPFRDDQGVLRVGGRLARSALPLETKHPILLPKDSRITQLILEETHRLVAHGGRNAVIAQLRRRYWVPRATKLVGSIVLQLCCVP